MSARLVALLMAAILGDPSRHGQALNNASPGGRAGCYLPRVDDHAFLDHVAGRLASLPGVAAVTLGGSRAAGTHRPDSDWDFGIYYRGHFDPQALRDLGWPGEVSEVGGWSPGVFNGGAWLEIDGRRCDVHYRVDHSFRPGLPVPDFTGISNVTRASEAAQDSVLSSPQSAPVAWVRLFLQ
jgi:hypothetical protein